VVVVVGRRVRSLDGDKRKKKSKKLTFFFLVSISGVVGADLVGQVVGHVYGGWLGDDGGGEVGTYLERICVLWGGFFLEKVPVSCR
jgi:hypothetical protein